MIDQDPRERLLRHIVGIRVGVPYSATIRRGSAEFSGQAIFSARNGLTFEFFSEDEHAYRHMFDDSPPESELHIDSLDLYWKVLITNESQNIGGSGSSVLTINGIVGVTWFGGTVHELKSIVVGYGSIPTGWAGNAPGSYYEGYNRERLGRRIIEGLQLNFEDWSVHLHEVPEHRVVGSVRHIATIKRTRTFSSCEAKRFLDDLHLFFSFLWGGSSGMVFARGSMDSETLWGGLGRRIPQPPGRLQNWYSIDHMPPGRHALSLSDIFTSLCDMEGEDKAVMTYVIRFYATSDELIQRNDVGQLLPAIIFSHSALEKLVQWISGKRTSGDKFDHTVAQSCAKMSIVDESRHSEISDLVKRLRRNRNSIVHIKEMHVLDTGQELAGWNRSQCVVEAMILRELGYAGVLPNRTRDGFGGELRLDAQARPRAEGDD